MLLLLEILASVTSLLFIVIERSPFRVKSPITKLASLLKNQDPLAYKVPEDVIEGMGSLALVDPIEDNVTLPLPEFRVRL